MKKFTGMTMKKSDVNHKIDTKNYYKKERKVCLKRDLCITLMGMLGETNVIDFAN